jgi:hypothetical protein
MPAVFRIDVTVSTAIVHFACSTGFHHDAGTAVANRVNFVLCERRAFFVFGVDKENHERWHEDGHEIVGVRFHAHSLRIMVAITQSPLKNFDSHLRPTGDLRASLGVRPSWALVCGV